MIENPRIWKTDKSIRYRNEINPQDITPEAIQRFWNKVSIGSESECWEWTAHTDKGGYGMFWFNGKDVGAHRFSWVAHFGQLELELLVCHTCDNPKCVNPKHLFKGTYEDNTNDMYTKHRKNNGDTVSRDNCVLGDTTMSKKEEELYRELWLSDPETHQKIQQVIEITGMTKSEVMRRLIQGMTIEELTSKVLPDLKVESRKK